MRSVPNWLFFGLVFVITGLWATGIALTLFSSSFQMPEQLNGAFGLVTALILTNKAKSRDRDGRDHDDE